MGEWGSGPLKLSLTGRKETAKAAASHAYSTLTQLTVHPYPRRYQERNAERNGGAASGPGILCGSRGHTGELQTVGRIRTCMARIAWRPKVKRRQEALKREDQKLTRVKSCSVTKSVSVGYKP
ncbi:hypothetical protein EVAR_14766_1 [Eumeta japonica]|uniref:Uncharacterized protein n=1 Tax=Eumeta variegata TaxID=151549 RepID=A0A4C1TWE4_EUMVA|nr:hypothetical protein EVAR_14766_1 [Eumeta japonica]